MPEPQENTETQELETKPVKILEFFKVAVKETKKDKVKPLTKIVIRRLPPRLTQAEFLNEISLPPHDYFYFVRGDLSLGIHAFSRAYVNFQNVDDIFTFKEKYDDHPFRDDQGKEYHAVVEWAPIQRIPKKNPSKKKPSKGGSLETDPKYIEFLAKLEEQKNTPGNASEYFLETDISTSKETKITTTPLLEFIKMKRQKKIDLRNENRSKKREAERERRRKEDELRKFEKPKKNREDKDKKIAFADLKEEGKSGEGDSKELLVKKSEAFEGKETTREKKIEIKSPRSEKKETKTSRRDEKRDRTTAKPSTSDSALHQHEKSDEKDVSDVSKTSEEKIPKPGVRKSSSEGRPMETSKSAGPKSKFRYSEQRTREREVRNQKLEAMKEKEEPKENNSSATDSKDDSSKKVDKKVDTQKNKIVREPSDGGSDDASNPDLTVERSTSGNKRDPRTERRIRNKDRPSMEIYRPGMGRFSKQRLETKKDDPSSSKGSSGASEVDEVVEKVESAVKSLTFSRSVNK